jgi:hypothetical protein
MVSYITPKRARSRLSPARFAGLFVALAFALSSAVSVGASTLIDDSHSGVSPQTNREAESVAGTDSQDHFSTLHREYIWWTTSRESIAQDNRADDWRFIEDNVYLPGAVVPSFVGHENSNSLYDYVAPARKSTSARTIVPSLGEGWLRGNTSELSSESRTTVDRADSIKRLQGQDVQPENKSVTRSWVPGNGVR